MIVMANSESNLTWSKSNVSYRDRCNLIDQTGFVVWLTGISSSGKSTISTEVEGELYKKNILSYRLDGDNLRHGLCSNLGFSEGDRNENVRRVIETASLFKDAGIVTLVSLISPFKKMREDARKIIGSDYFLEVYVKADLETCIRRDPKGLYQRALIGEIKDFTAISSPYEEPDNPDLVIDTTNTSIQVCTNSLLNAIWNKLKEIR